LATQAKLNVQFDPKLGPQVDLQVVERWTNVTVRQALQVLLDNYGWEITQTPWTPILRIAADAPASVGLARTKIDLSGIVPTNGTVSAVDEVKPAINIEGVTLTDEIRTLAAQAGLNIIFDPLLTAQKDPPMVTSGWVKITARKALQETLHNAGLQLTQLPGNPILRVAAKRP
jgi:hypothetical protein